MSWRKSSHSGGNDDSDCVEVAFAEQVGVRDSKNPAPVLIFPEGSFRAFVELACRCGAPGR